MKPATPSPLYVLFFPEIAEIARQHGYAMAVHGSVARDLDIICIPWTEASVAPETVVAAMQEEFSFLRELGKPILREHGRRVWTLTMGGAAFLDLSFTPRSA